MKPVTYRIAFRNRMIGESGYQKNLQFEDLDTAMAWCQKNRTVMEHYWPVPFEDGTKLLPWKR